MSISGYFGSRRSDIRADRKDTGSHKETEKLYQTIDEYDPVLRSHCGLLKPTATNPNDKSSQDYWLNAVEAAARKNSGDRDE